MLECLKGLDPYTKVLLNEQSYFVIGDFRLLRQVEDDLSAFHYRVLLPVQIKSQRKKEQKTKRQKRKKTAQRDLARHIGSLLKAHGYELRKSREGIFAKVIGIALKAAKEPKGEPLNIIRQVWDDIEKPPR